MIVPKRILYLLLLMSIPILGVLAVGLPMSLICIEGCRLYSFSIFMFLAIFLEVIVAIIYLSLVKMSHKDLQQGYWRI